MPRKLTDIEIAARIVPAVLRWPSPEIAKTIAWDRLRDAVQAMRGLVRVVDDGCLQAEQNADLNPDGIARRRAALGRQALTELEQFKPLQVAERAVAENIDYLEKKMVELPQRPTHVADVALAQEIRSHIRHQKSRVDFVLKHMSNQHILGAVLTSPAFLSGLSSAEFDVVRERARTALHPEQAEMQKWLKQALDEVREGVAATKRMLVERCQIGGDEVENSQSRSTHPSPAGAAQAAAKTATAA